ncbi:DUF7935 family protein [Pseudofulvibacter geojedonensis]|uniref:Uncharacterized protein n=1 Tax=Pseudofulvibacter geojedonensis TaxID=1123758 RepID=A0ABW3I3A8_9FLAO
MDLQKITELILYLFPAIITGGVAYMFFKKHTANEEGRRRYLIQKEAQATALPLRLQAYERMALFLERINPSSLLLRVNPISNDKDQYQQLIVANIEQEFEHNLAQQVYISDECWNVIKTAKSTTIQMVRNVAGNPETEDANKLREIILTSLLDKSSPSETAMAFVKSEVGEMF